ncbi:3-keto-disaccharide hydrolase [Flavitalea flava]
MRRILFLPVFYFAFISLSLLVSQQTAAQDSVAVSPSTAGEGWSRLFKDDLSNAIYPKGIWVVTEGVLTATKDQSIWSEKAYDNFILDLDFKNADGTNSGVIVHASDLDNWIPHSVEIQIADDYSKEWSKAPANWQCAAIFGHQAATKKLVKKPGEWNHYTITCKDRKIWVALNGELVNTCDMSLYSSAVNNPDGTKAPEWLSNPMATLPLHGHIGLQGKHAGAPIYFRNIMIREL